MRFQLVSTSLTEPTPFAKRDCSVCASNCRGGLAAGESGIIRFILFALDPNRAAILLVGGNKRGDKRWHKEHLPIGDARFRRHLERLEG
jgi:hypothetical protein